MGRAMLQEHQIHRARDQDEQHRDTNTRAARPRGLPDRAAFRGDGRRNNPISRLHWTKGTEDLGAGYDRARHTLHRPDDRLREDMWLAALPGHRAFRVVVYTIRG